MFTLMIINVAISMSLALALSLPLSLFFSFSGLQFSVCLLLMFDVIRKTVFACAHKFCWKIVNKISVISYVSFVESVALRFSCSTVLYSFNSVWVFAFLLLSKNKNWRNIDTWMCGEVRCKTKDSRDIISFCVRVCVCCFCLINEVLIMC